MGGGRGTSAATDHGEEEDEVVRELEVFVTGSPLDVYLMQFPLKPEFAEPPTITKVRFKKSFKKMEVELPFKSSSSQGLKPVINQVFHSATVARNTCLAGMIIHNDAVHLTVFQDVLQMRPSFRSKQQPGSWGKDDDDDVSEAEEEKEAPVEQIHMKRRETERSQSARAQSYSHIQMLEENEPWLTLEPHEVGAYSSQMKLDYLVHDADGMHQEEAMEVEDGSVAMA